jgi:hypothetical protein
MNMTPISRLKELLSYDHITGNLCWRVNRGKCKAGKVISCRNGYGYIVVRIDNVLIRAHRAAWAIYYGHWPQHEIDHINGIRDDNRILNLREATHLQNMKNIRKPITNKSGHKGVTFDQINKKWRSDIRANGIRYNLGRFASKEEAIEAYKNAAKKLHGIFSNDQ